MSIYQAHRSALMQRLFATQTAAVVATHHLVTRNHDCHYRFRPHSDFWYLTGFAEPDAVLVMLPGKFKLEDSRCVLFLRERNKEMEIWDGKRLGVERAPAVLGVEEAFPIDDLWHELPRLLAGRERVMAQTGFDIEFDRHLLEALSGLRGRARKGVQPPVELVDPLPLLHELRLHKTAGEIANMRRAAAITAEAHIAAMAQARPGVNEYEIDALIESTFRRSGSTGPAYNSIVAGGEGACILHYIENNAVLKDGDLLLIDAGAEWEYYAADVTRTFPVNGTFSPEQRALYEVVLAAQEAAVAAVRPGVPTSSIHEVATHHLAEGLIHLGLCQGSPAEVIESGAIREFYMHGTSHWLGLDVHDQGAYSLDGKSRPLEPGMVLTVEPGLYVDPENEAVDPRWRGIGIRIEDDILVTEGGHENLTVAIPKSVAAVEAACQAGDLACR
ncbi:MAG: aminopeptidase P N-terminal domain-containing protein [Planctomycetota bacterium]